MPDTDPLWAPDDAEALLDDPEVPSVACQLGRCGDCLDPAECTCTCHVEDHHEDPR